MRRPPIVPSLASLCLLFATSAAATAASLISIETRPVNGAAIVTEEEGVRVYRPLPSLRYMILNPDGRTPLNLTVEERTVVVHQHLYSVPSESTNDGAGRFVGGYGLAYPRVHHRDRRHVRRSRPGGYMIRVPGAARGR
jgi:hypothetical protein